MFVSNMFSLAYNIQSTHDCRLLKFIINMQQQPKHFMFGVDYGSKETLDRTFSMSMKTKLDLIDMWFQQDGSEFDELVIQDLGPFNWSQIVIFNVFK